MPIKYILDTENSLVLYEISGVVNPDDIDRISDDITARVEPESSYKEFYMFKDDAAYLAVSKGYFEKIRDEILQRDEQNSYRRDKTALVTFDTYGKMVIPLWKEMANRDASFRCETEAFDSVAAAADWLGVGLSIVEDSLDKIKLETTT